MARVLFEKPGFWYLGDDVASATLRERLRKTANKKSLGLEGLRDRNYQGASTMFVI
jgi:hypothetical protein